MAYARFLDSDVYVYPHVHGYFTCHNCAHNADPKTPSATAMVEHLRYHQSVGDRVPESAIEEILADGDATGWGEKSG